jgi:hypothetical protein
MALKCKQTLFPSLLLLTLIVYTLPSYAKGKQKQCPLLGTEENGQLSLAQVRYWDTKLSFLKDDKNFSDEKLAECSSEKAGDSVYPCLGTTGDFKTYQSIRDNQAENLKALTAKKDLVQAVFPRECDSRFPRLLAALALRGVAGFNAVHLSTMATPDTSAIVVPSLSEGETKEFLRCLKSIYYCADKAKKNVELSSHVELASQVKRRVQDLFTAGRSWQMRKANHKLAAAFNNAADALLLTDSRFLP